MTQYELDFVDRDELIGRLCLPKSITVSDRAVSSRAVRAVLFRLNQHLGNKLETFVGQMRLARETEYGEKTIRRAIEALQALGLVTVRLGWVDRYGKTLNHYSIDWKRARELAQVQTHPELAQAEPDAEPPQERTKTEPSQVRTEASSVVPTDRPFSRTDRPLGTTDRPFSRTDRPPGGLQPRPTKREPSFKNQGVVGVFDSGGDGRPLPAFGVEELNLPERVQLLWLEAVRRGVLPETDRWRRVFFALCHSVWRSRDAFANPPGFLVAKLKAGRQAVLQQVDDQHDDAWAKRAIADVDGVVLVGSVGHLASAVDVGPLAESESCEQFERRRSDEMRRLWEAAKRGDFTAAKTEKVS